MKIMNQPCVDCQNTGRLNNSFYGQEVILFWTKFKMELL